MSLLAAAQDTAVLTLDSLAGAAGALRDTITPSPLPGPLTTLVRFLFQVPQWIQIGGVFVGAAVGAVVLLYLWRRRQSILAWLKGAGRPVIAGLVALAVLLFSGLAFAGTKTWDFMQHDNNFCTGCHIMEAPIGRFAAGAGKHEDRQCHDCHQQSIWASTRQLYLWVLLRPDEIKPHAPVPNVRCEGCHQKSDGRESFEHVRNLAGHKAHFLSDSSALEGLNCVTCHGLEVHSFVPSARTCAQSGCHENQAVRMRGMVDLPEINCVTCHNFRADLPALADRDSAVSALVPSVNQCQTCHQMEVRPLNYNPRIDPHQGRCGSCHDVHADTVPAMARSSCVECHSGLERSAFHNGANHKRVRDDCLLCHQPHAASVDVSDCAGCHTRVRANGPLSPPLPFDTLAPAVSLAPNTPDDSVRRRLGNAGEPLARASPEFDSPSGFMDQNIYDAVDASVQEPGSDTDAPVQYPGQATGEIPDAPIVAAQDSFPHARHTSLTCLTCHSVTDPDRGLVFDVPRGCDLCHHRSFFASNPAPDSCVRCHTAGLLTSSTQTTVAIKVGTNPSAPRPVDFDHATHATTSCTSCHIPPELTPPDSVRSCQSCHDQHHDAARNCGSCHTRGTLPEVHTLATHVACDACHTSANIAKLTPTRAFCISCHRPQSDHLLPQGCTSCHFLQTEAEFKARLLKGAE